MVSEIDLLNADRYLWLDGYSLAFILVASYEHHQEHLDSIKTWLEEHAAQNRKEKPMNDQTPLISNAFQTFLDEAPQQAQAWGAMVQGLANASALDKKTSALAYLAVLAVLAAGERCPISCPGGQTIRRHAG